jgi:NADH-quinone oxidoreductase subunit E
VNAPMIQVSKDTYEDLTPEIFEGLIEAFQRGEHPEPGPQNGRRTSMPITGPTSLMDIQYADDDVPAARPRSPAMAEVAVYETRASDGTSAGGTNPAATAASNEEAGRVDPSGRADEAAARSPAGKKPKRVRDTHQSGPKNPGTRSDRDSNDPVKGR